MQDPDLLRLPRQEQWAILEAATGQPRTYFLREGTERLAAGERALIRRWAQARHRGVPLAYLLGFREFYGLRFWVNPSVLIPRPETECLVDHALAAIVPNAQGTRATQATRVLDLGTGSGCIIIALLKTATARGIPVTAWATDVSAQALCTARNNACWHGVSIVCREGRWFEALGHEAKEASDGFDLIVSNPPYVAQDDPHLAEEVRAHEPATALSGTTPNPQGLSDLSAIIAQASAYLRPGGSLLLEHGWTQQAAVIRLCQEAGFASVTGFPDLSGLPRLVQARL